LRWFGHVERKDDNDCVKRCTTREVEGIRHNLFVWCLTALSAKIGYIVPYE